MPRGRPRRFPVAEVRRAVLQSDGNTQRHGSNWLYKIEALRQFYKDPRFEWLCSNETAIARREGKMKHTILTELGRVHDRGVREDIALELCQTCPTTGQAIAMIRALRLGKQPQGTATHLATVLRETINAYITTHTVMTWDEIRQALHRVYADVDAAEHASN